MARSTLISPFMIERCEREKRYYRVYDSYRPNFSKASVTRKFYSKYEPTVLESADPSLVKAIKKFKHEGPKEKHAWPETENQWYGWFLDPLVSIDRKDNRFYFQRKTSEEMKILMKLKMEKGTQGSKSGGPPFKL